MEKVILYCKSYWGDLERTVRLYESIKKHNKDNIPFYVSTSQRELNLFQQHFPNEILLTDEDICKQNNLHDYQGRRVDVGRVVNHIRFNIWRTGLAHNYFCLDADAYFIRDFYVNDFIFKDNIPYTQCTENEELFLFYSTFKDEFEKDIRLDWIDRSRQIAELFHINGSRVLEFGPNPVLYNHKVLESFYNDYLKPNNLTAEQVCTSIRQEYQWYGYYLLASQLIPLIPVKNWFKVYHYENQYTYDQKLNITEKDLGEYYLGVIMQSNWHPNSKGELKWGAKKTNKSFGLK